MNNIKFGTGIDQEVIAWSQSVRDRYLRRLVKLLNLLGMRPIYLTFLGVVAMLFSGLVFGDNQVLAFGLFGLGLVFDGLDGPLARMQNKTGRSGEIFDAFADTLGLWLVVIGMMGVGFVGVAWAAIYLSNYALMQFLIFYHLERGRKIAVPWRSRFFVFLIFLWWLTTGMFLFDLTFLVFGIYMITENIRLLLNLKWK